MTSEEIIDLVTGEFDRTESWHLVHSVNDVETVFRQIESFLNRNDLQLEFDVEPGDFEEVPISNDPDELRHEVKFEIPILDTELKLEFFYFRQADNEYRILLDVDFYFDMDDYEQDENN